MTTAYPLHWPQHRPRTRQRENSAFKTSMAVARDALMQELQRLGARDVILSTNIKLRNDGLPYAGEREPQDPGVAVYFQYKGKAMCFACDRWTKVYDNMQAVRRTIEALRGIARWGTGDMLQAAFAGFTALPAPMQVQRDWWTVLKCDRDAQLHVAEAQYKILAMENHPDQGGDPDKMAEINAAIRAARKERSLA